MTIPVHLQGERVSDRKRCPHAEIRFCPLYHAAHQAGAAVSCLDAGADGYNGCAIDRGVLTYAQGYAVLAINHPRLVAECEWLEAKETSARQVDRNMRLNGIH